MKRVFVRRDFPVLCVNYQFNVLYLHVQSQVMKIKIVGIS